MAWWKDKVLPEDHLPAAAVSYEEDSAEILTKIHANQKELAAQSAIRIIGWALLFFVAIEVGGNFSEIAKMTDKNSPAIDFAAWKIWAGLEDSDVTVIVTALLVFNATFAVAFVDSSRDHASSRSLNTLHNRPSSNWHDATSTTVASSSTPGTTATTGGTSVRCATRCRPLASRTRSAFC